MKEVKTIVGSVVGALVAGAAPEVYRDVKSGLSTLWGKVRAKREEQRLAELRRKGQTPTKTEAIATAELEAMLEAPELDFRDPSRPALDITLLDLSAWAKRGQIARKEDKGRGVSGFRSDGDIRLALLHLYHHEFVSLQEHSSDVARAAMAALLKGYKDEMVGEPLTLAGVPLMTTSEPPPPPDPKPSPDTN